MIQEIIDVRYLAHTKICVIKGLQKYRKKGKRWIENPNFKNVKHLPDAVIKKTAEFEIQEDTL